MTPVSDTAQATAYELAVTALYFDLPEAPVSLSPADRRLARCWFERGVPVEVVETALLLGSLRRLMRPPQAPPLARFRSLAYFQPVVEELLEAPSPPGYRDYLRHRIQRWLTAGR